MKKFQSTLIFIMLGIAFSSLFLSSCKKDITENIDLKFKPTLFEYTGLIRVYDAADSSVPANLQIDFAEGQDDMLYSIVGGKDLKFSSSGTLEFGLHPSIKPSANEPVVINFELTAPGYISQLLTIEIYEDIPNLKKEFSLMNKTNLPAGVSFTEFSGELKDGVLQEDMVIRLGGGLFQNGLKNSTDEALNTITIHNGTSFYYYDYDPNRNPRWQKTEVTETGQVTGYAFFYQSFQGESGYRYYSNGAVADNGDTTLIPSGSAMMGFGGWQFAFMLNGKHIWAVNDQPGSFSASANLSVPKSGFNLQTGELYKAGDVVKLYNFNWSWKPTSQGWTIEYVYDLVSTQVLSQSSTVNSDYFALETIELNNPDMLWIGSIFPTIDYFDSPDIRLAGDNSAPSWSNNDFVSQHLERTFSYGGQSVTYYFGGWVGFINQPNYIYNNTNLPAFSFLPGTYTKFITYKYTWSDGPSFSLFLDQNIHEEITISDGSPHPFDFLIPAGKHNRVTLTYSIKCNNAEIKPSLSVGIGSLYGSNDIEEGIPEIYVYGNEGFASTYMLKIGQAYKFYIEDPRNGTRYMRIDTVKSANTVIEINNEEVCDFIDSGGF